MPPWSEQGWLAVQVEVEVDPGARQHAETELRTPDETEIRVQPDRQRERKGEFNSPDDVRWGFNALLPGSLAQGHS